MRCVCNLKRHEGEAKVLFSTSIKAHVREQLRFIAVERNEYKDYFLLNCSHFGTLDAAPASLDFGAAALETASDAADVSWKTSCYCRSNHDRNRGTVKHER
jgi:hypothetical protein